PPQLLEEPLGRRPAEHREENRNHENEKEDRGDEELPETARVGKSGRRRDQEKKDYRRAVEHALEQHRGEKGRERQLPGTREHRGTKHLSDLARQVVRRESERGRDERGVEGDLGHRAQEPRPPEGPEAERGDSHRDAGEQPAGVGGSDLAPDLAKRQPAEEEG